MSGDEVLAAEQAALVRALTGGARDGEVAPPPGLDPTRLGAMAQLLLDKRLRAVAHACPVLRRELGTRLAALFAEFARGGGGVGTADAVADAVRFLRWLRLRGVQSDALRRVAVELRLRRGPAVAAAWLPTERRLLVGVRLPAARARLLSIAIG